MALLDHGEDRKPVSNTLSPARPRRALEHDIRRPEPASVLAPELACLRGHVPVLTLQAASYRSRRIGIGADRVLIDWGVVSEHAYLVQLAAHLRIPMARLDAACALAPWQVASAASEGMIAVRRGEALAFVIAPRHLSARRLTDMALARPDLVARFELATTAGFNRFLQRHGGAALAHRAAEGLAARWPALSAAGSGRTWRRIAAIIGFAAAVAVPSLLGEAVWTAVLTAAFVSLAGFRLLGGLVPDRPGPPRRYLPGAELPIYTVMVALYREASSVAPLLQALGDLDYPREKLDVILVTEADDTGTRAAIARLQPLPHLQVLSVPAVGPQTKPKALNYALPFARGSFLAVFDAEDRPEPGQLRAALDAFAHHGEDVACVQASLCIDNVHESLLSRMFAAEYAGQFDVFLRGLSALRLPLPLGGSSNHFRTHLLREIGGWDAYNVTEDADLGIRLARFGFHAATFASTTYEEAPVHLGAWLRQRSRWMKGWMQTAQVHLRRPRQLLRDLGLIRSCAVALIAGGTALTALAYPVMIMTLALHGAEPLHLLAIAAGYTATLTTGVMGLARRRQLRQSWILLLAPLYWGLLSAAAWRALWQLLHDPHHWEKTQHGLSARSKAMRRSA